MDSSSDEAWKTLTEWARTVSRQLHEQKEATDATAMTLLAIEESQRQIMALIKDLISSWKRAPDPGPKPS